jgi:hypothetical protein
MKKLFPLSRLFLTFHRLNHQSRLVFRPAGDHTNEPLIRLTPLGAAYVALIDSPLHKLILSLSFRYLPLSTAQIVLRFMGAQ